MSMIARFIRTIFVASYSTDTIQHLVSYLYLNLSINQRQLLKRLIYTNFRALFMHTSSYRRWQANAYLHHSTSQAPSMPPHALQDSTGVNAAAQPSATFDPIGDYDIPYRKISRQLNSPLNDTASPPRRLTFHEPSLTEAVELVRQLQLRAFDDPLYSIIVPCYDNFHLTVACIQSIITNSGDDISYEVIVADDCSEQSQYSLLQSVPNIRYFRPASNVGFSRICNQAAAKGHGQFLVFLNNDAQVHEGWLAGLHESFRRPAVGITGPKVLNLDGTLQEAGCQLTAKGNAIMVGYGKNPHDRQFSFERAVDYVSGCCLAIRTDLYHQLHGFDTMFSPFYFEDADLCMRAKVRGYLTFYQPLSTVTHKLSASLPQRVKSPTLLLNKSKFQLRWLAHLQANALPKILTWYLPQFHPIPENDYWWGKGFTEWRNVSKASPRFGGHYQPRRPAELGYYDLRVPSVLEKQAKLAQMHGIYGFVFYYYWFSGRTILDAPLAHLIRQPALNMPFCICWANENWTRRWDGRDNEILLKQTYSAANASALIKDLIPILSDPRYVRILNKPLIMIYRGDTIPQLEQMIAIWRAECRANRIPDVFIVLVESMSTARHPIDPASVGADAAVEFPPHEAADGNILKILDRVPEFRGEVYDYEKLVVNYSRRDFPHYTRFKSVIPGWDNTPRMPNTGHVFHKSSPGAFGAWVEHALRRTAHLYSADERFLFINSWNEWGEGANIEPDERFGRAYLEAIRIARQRLLEE